MYACDSIASMVAMTMAMSRQRRQTHNNHCHCYNDGDNKLLFYTSDCNYENKDNNDNFKCDDKKSSTTISICLSGKASGVRLLSGA